MEGYAKLASLMGAHPEVGILRRFGALNAQNLLYLQAELVNLESEFRTISDNSRQIDSRDWFSLSISKNDTNDEGSVGDQWRVALMIRDRLKEYSR